MGIGNQSSAVTVVGVAYSLYIITIIKSQIAAVLTVCSSLCNITDKPQHIGKSI